MASAQCLRKSNCQMYEKFSPKKLLKLVKAVKPVLKLMRRRQRTNVVVPSTCNYDIVESFQNDVNEFEIFRLDFKFFQDEPCGSNEADENLKNEELEKQLLKKLQDDAVCCARGSEDGPGWAPRSDIDICKRGDEYMTGRQRAERQAPVAII